MQKEHVFENTKFWGEKRYNKLRELQIKCMACVLVSQNFHNKVPKTGSQKHIASQFWRLEIGYEGIGRVGSKPVWQYLFHASLLTFGGLLAIFGVAGLQIHDTDLCRYLHVLFFLCSICLCVQISPFYKETCYFEIELTLITSFYLDYLLKNLFPNKFTEKF